MLKKIVKGVLITISTLVGGFVLLVIYFAINPKKDLTKKYIETTISITPTEKFILVPTIVPTQIIKPTPIASNSIILKSTNTPTPIVINKVTPTQKVIVKTIVKKSSSGICHSPGTTYYDRTTNYTSYNSIDQCLESGGRLPKN